jgi:hypothetical protein
MALGISSGIKSYIRPRFWTQRSSQTARSGDSNTLGTGHEVVRTVESELLDELPPPLTSQLDSQFFQRLPLEIRKIIYDHVWGAHGRQHHVYMTNHGLTNARCVMDSRDEDPDLIQKEMDRINEWEHVDSFSDQRMRMWYARLVSSWGHRHWRCEERVKYGSIPTGSPNFMSMMLVCKRM